MIDPYNLTRNYDDTADAYGNGTYIPSPQHQSRVSDTNKYLIDRDNGWGESYETGATPSASQSIAVDGRWVSKNMEDPQERIFTFGFYLWAVILMFVVAGAIL